MKAIILVGGMGTRLRPLTLEYPKPLLPILNKPFISYQLDLLHGFGVQDVMLAIGHQASRWHKNLKPWIPRGLRVHYSFEEKPRGTGGAIRLGFDRFPKLKIGESVVVLNGDVFINLNARAFKAFHERNKSQGTVALVRVPDISNFGHVQYGSDKRIQRFQEKHPVKKPGWINAGAYILTDHFIRQIPNTPSSIEKDVFPLMLEKKIPMFGYPISGYWNDIGTPASYLNAHRDLLAQSHLKIQRRAGRMMPKSTAKACSLWMGRKTVLSKAVTLKGFVCLGHGVHVASGATIENSVIHDGTIVGKDAILKNAIIGRNCRIGMTVRVSDGMVLGEKSILTSFTKT